MQKNQLYFLSDQYYKDFPDENLMKNKETINNQEHKRPCFFAFADTKNPEILWLVPISSQIEKYRLEEKKKIHKYGRCNTIRFGTVLGRESAFLIQNMCPVTSKYVSVYVNKINQPIQIDGRLAADITKNAHEVLGISRRGAKIIFPDVSSIYETLVLQLEHEKNKFKSKLPISEQFARAKADLAKKSCNNKSAPKDMPSL